MPDASQTQQSSLPDAELLARASIGRHVVYYALAVTALLGTTAIIAGVYNVTDAKERYGFVKDVLTIVLPLVGTWVGTVLAFYFSRENFVAAASQTASLVRQLTPEQRQIVHAATHSPHKVRWPAWWHI